MLPRHDNVSLPGISVLISTKDRRQDLDRALVSLHKLDYPKDKLEIVVVEETNDPRPPEGARYVAIPVEHRGFGYTRRVAVEHARHDILLFTDDDCVVEPAWASELVRCFENDVGGVAGAVLVEPTNVLGYCENVLGFPGGGLRYVERAQGKPFDTEFLSTCNCAYRRSAVEEAGGFEIDLRHGGEDFLLSRRVAAKHRCRYTPLAVVYHKPRASWRGIARWFARRGRSSIDLARFEDLPKDALWRRIVASPSLRVAVLGAMMIVFGWRAAPLLMGVAALYYAVMLKRYFFGYRHYRRLAIWLTTPVVKVVMDLSAEVGRVQAVLDRWRKRRASV